jgi:hypothetical protein
MEVILGLSLTFTGLVLIGYALGWNRAIRKFRRPFHRLTNEVIELQGKADTDEARFGIDVGKRYATRRVRDTLDAIDQETIND